MSGRSESSCVVCLVSDDVLHDDAMLVLCFLSRKPCGGICLSCEHYLAWIDNGYLEIPEPHR